MIAVFELLFFCFAFYSCCNDHISTCYDGKTMFVKQCKGGMKCYMLNQHGPAQGCFQYCELPDNYILDADPVQLFGMEFYSIFNSSVCV